MINFTLKWLIFVLVLLGLVLYSFERGASGQGQARQREDRVNHLLKSWTYNGEDQTLSWVMTEWRVPKDGKPMAMTERKYRINLQEAVMMVDGEKRRLNRYEPVLIYPHLEAVAKYLRDSVGWWRDSELPKAGRDGIALP